MSQNILYIGSLDKVTNSFRRYNTLIEMGNDVVGMDVDDYILNSPFRSFHFHLNIGPGINSLNKKIRKQVAENDFDIIWVDNKTYLNKKTHQFIKSILPKAKTINVITDDPFGRFRRHWIMLRKTIPLFDLFFVQRKVNIQELKNLGAKNVSICLRSFDPNFNRPIELTEEEKKYYHTQVGFVGTYEDVRSDYIAYLINNGIDVAVTGNDFPNAKNWETIQPHFRSLTVYGDAYNKTICGMEIALHFLRHSNRDEQDSRTFEITSCGRFMLAERSDLHLQLFEENKEAVYFSSKEEMLEKVRYYIHHPEEREAIAKAGYERCMLSGYTHEDRLKQILEETNSLS